MIKRIKYYGLWAEPFSFILTCIIIRSLMNTFHVSCKYWMLIAFVLSWLFPLYVFLTHRRILHKKEDDEVKLSEAFVNKPRSFTPEKRQAERPETEQKLLYKKPTGIVYGKVSNGYVCKPLNTEGHSLIVGGSGSGKSSMLISTLLINDSVKKFVFDPKSELYDISVRLADQKACKIDFLDRSSYGFDPFFKLTDTSTESDVIEVMEEITNSLITVPADTKEPYWKEAAKALLNGLMIAYFKQGLHDFIRIIDRICGSSMQEQAQAIVEKTEEGSIEHDLLAEIYKVEDVTFGGFAMEVRNAINIFRKDQDIRYAFSTNPLKATPNTLKEKSVFLCVEEYRLTTFSGVCQMIFNLLFSELERRSKDEEPILIIMDELPRLLSAGGRMAHLLDGARTLRSRKVQLIMIVQSLEALMIAYSENEAMDLISNCSFIAVLNATTPKTQKLICDLCGCYQERRTSWSGGGAQRKTSVHYEDKDIVTPADLITLPQTGELILISPYGYNRFRKTPYFQESYFKRLAAEVKKDNEIIRGECAYE